MRIIIMYCSICELEGAQYKSPKYYYCESNINNVIDGLNMMMSYEITYII